MSNPTAAKTKTVPTSENRLTHLSFLISMLGKGLLGLSQILGGIFLAVTPAGTISKLVAWLTSNELVEDPSDPLVAWLHTLIHAVPVSQETFYTLYLIIHGALNLGLVLALLAGFRWAYPLSIAALVGFVMYQLSKYLHSSDPMMLILSAIDIVVIILIWREWRHHDAQT